MHHKAETSLTLREGSYRRNLKKYSSDVIWKKSSASREVPRIKGDLSNYRWNFYTVQPDNNCFWDHRDYKETHNARLFCGTSCLLLNRSGKPGTKISWSSMKRTIYIFFLDFVEMSTFLACNASAKLPVLNQCRVGIRRLFHYSL